MDSIPSYAPLRAPKKTTRPPFIATEASLSTAMPSSAYRPIALTEGGPAPAAPEPHAPRLQWVILFLLTLLAAALLGQKIVRVTETAAAAAAAGSVNGTDLAAMAPRRRKRPPGYFAMGMGRMGTSSSFVLRSRRRSIKNQVAKAATRSVILVGSHFGLGTELLRQVFTELCQRSRLSLRCDHLVGVHDLKSLASIKGPKKRRIVWLEKDASALRRTLRGLRAHAANFRMVHLLWDPMQACVAQWPLTLSHGGNVSLETLCTQALRMEPLAAVYKAAKRHRTRSLQLRLEDMVGAHPKAPWRQLFKFLELQEKTSDAKSSKADLSGIGSRAVTSMHLRDRVLNTAAPIWAHDALEKNASLMHALRFFQRELDYGADDDGRKLAASVAGLDA